MIRSLFLKIFLWFWAAQILIVAALYLVAVATQRGFDERLNNAVADNLRARTRAAAIAYEVGGTPALSEAWRFTRRELARRSFPNRTSNGNNGGPDSGPPDDSPFDFDPGARESFGHGPGDRGPRDHGPRDRPPNDGGRGPHHGGPEDRAAASLYLVTGPEDSPTLKLIAGPRLSNTVSTAITSAYKTGEASITETGGYSWVASRVDTPRGNHYVAAVPLTFPGQPPMPYQDWFRPRSDTFLRFLVVALTIGAVCFTLARYLTGPAVKLRNATHQFAAGDLKTRVGPLMGRRRDELADLGRDFDVMAERIESLLMSERRLLGDISHELRSPLARLQLALDLAEQTADPETKQYLARIESEAEELNGMIGQLLTLTRLENAVTAEKGSKDAAFIDLEQLVKHVCENADFEARAKGLRVELLHSESCQITGNGELLHSAIENVVRNALLHAPQSPKVEVTLNTAPHETVTPEDTAKVEAVIRVRDYGSGVPEESLQDLFRPFYRVAEARDRQTGGTGLGLSITERAVQFHGGTVTASNAEGGGLAVEIRLPLPEK